MKHKPSREYCLAMPIANCIVKSECRESSGSNLIDLWAQESDTSPAHMTVNIIASREQHGSPYSVMANLQMPSLWSDADISSLQLGLAKALAQHYQLDLSDVQVISTLVNSGLVVEAGKELQW